MPYKPYFNLNSDFESEGFGRLRIPDLKVACSNPTGYCALLLAPSFLKYITNEIHS